MTLYALRRHNLRMMFADSIHVVCFNRRVQNIPNSNLHHEKRMIIFVEREKWSYPRQQIRNGYSIGSDEPARDTYTWKVRVGQNEFVSMSHFAKHF